MEIENLKQSFIHSAEQRAKQFLETGNPQGDFWYAYERSIDNDRLMKVCALILCDAPKGDIRAALEDAMFTDRFLEEQCEALTQAERESRAKANYYEQKYGDK